MRLSWFYYVGRIITKLALLFLTHREVKGKENIPDSGPLVIIANHLSVTDPPILGSSVNKKMIFMAKEELFHSRLTGYFIRSFGSFPVRRGVLDRKALQQSEEVLRQGMALAMFPEGSRSPTAQLRPAFPGAALMALRSRARILPVGITGTENIKGKTWLFRRPSITINIGPAFELADTSHKLTKDKLIETTDIMMRRIAELLPSRYQGVYAKNKGNQDD